MSYTPISSYYTFSPHEVFPPDPVHSYRAARAASGFGAISDTFSPDAVMADIAISDQCYGPGGKGTADPRVASCNAASVRASKELAAALNALGYGPIAVDGSLSWKSAYAQYLSDRGLQPGPGLGVTKQALLTMQQDLRSGNTPGGGTPVEYEKVGGEYVPVGTKLTKQSKLALGLLAAGAVGAIVIVASRKKKRHPKAA